MFPTTVSPLWRERYPRLATVMDNNPLMPLGNSIRDNILIGCKRPFSISKGIDEAWLGRENNHEWGMEEFALLPEEGADEKLDLAKLPVIWEKVPGFPPIPVEKIGPGGLR